MSNLKKVISVSLGSSKRDHAVEVNLLGEKFFIKRMGTDGDIKKAIKIIEQYDGKIDAFGMGGIDLYIVAGKKRYELREAKKLKNAAKITPIVDGSGLKNSLEKKVVEYLEENMHINLHDKNVLLVCGVDRFGMAKALEKYGGKVTYGDLIFGLGLPIPLKSLKKLERAARLIAPIVSQLPFEVLYPIGNKQEVILNKFNQYYQAADIIAGDFLYIKRYLPPYLPGKMIITNTVTEEDLTLLKERGVSTLITTTPELEGRSFGTNVMEATLIALTGAQKELTPQRYQSLLDKVGFMPRVVNFKDAYLA